MDLGDPDGALRPARELLERFVHAGEVDGAALAVARRGQPMAEYAVGEAAPGRQAGPDTLWPLASISKSYTASTVSARRRSIARSSGRVGGALGPSWPSTKRDAFRILVASRRPTRILLSSKAVSAPGRPLAAQ